MNNLTFYFIIAAVGIILPLAIYAGYLLRKVKAHQQQQEKAAKEATKAQQANLYAHDQKIYSSVGIIAKAMKEQQCDYSEGCWRISVLLDSLKTQEPLNSQFPAIFELYEGIRHLSILDERKQLAKRDRMKQDLERMKLETKLADSITKELDLLITFTEQQHATLNL